MVNYLSSVQTSMTEQFDKLEVFKLDTIWTIGHSLVFYGIPCHTRMTIVKLENGDLFVHSPIKIDENLKTEIDKLGIVKYIIAPNFLHHIFISDFSKLYPDAEIFISPVLKEKLEKHQIKKYILLDDELKLNWCDEIKPILIKGNTMLGEFVFFHKKSKTLIVTDLIEYLTEDVKGMKDMNIMGKIFSWSFDLYGKPKPSPEFQWYTNDKIALMDCLENIIKLDFDSIIMSHGKLNDGDPKKLISMAYKMKSE